MLGLSFSPVFSANKAFAEIPYTIFKSIDGGEINTADWIGKPSEAEGGRMVNEWDFEAGKNQDEFKKIKYLTFLAFFRVTVFCSL